MVELIQTQTCNGTHRDNRHRQRVEGQIFSLSGHEVLTELSSAYCFIFGAVLICTFKVHRFHFSQLNFMSFFSIFNSSLQCFQVFIRPVSSVRCHWSCIKENPAHPTPTPQTSPGQQGNAGKTIYCVLFSLDVIPSPNPYHFPAASRKTSHSGQWRCSSRDFRHPNTVTLGEAVWVVTDLMRNKSLRGQTNS